MKKHLLCSETDRGPRTAKIFTVALFGALLFSLFTAAGARAQYREDPVDKDLERRKSDLGSGDESKIAEFAKGFYLARWTQSENLAKLHTLRRETAADVAALRSENKKTCQRVLVQLFAEMAQAEDLMPAVRYNAALAMGMFNERESGTGGGGDAGIPYFPAISVMADIFNSSEDNAKGNKVPDYVVLAILINLDRYAALGVSDAADRKAVTDVFLKTLDPAFGKKHNYSAETTAWFQKKAVDGLAAFESPSQGENDTVVLDTFIRLLRDKSIDSTVQCAALRGIGAMKFGGKDDFDFEPLVSAIARAALYLNQKEIAFIDEENIRSQVESTQGGAGRTAAPSAMGGGNTAGAVTVVSRVKYDAESLRMAIDGGNGKGGVLPLLTKESQAPLKEALESLLGRIDRTNNYIDFGEQGIADDFDAKKVKRPKVAKGAEPALMVNSAMVRYFLADETDFYQDLAESLAAADAEKQR
ncbi:MAG: hypothetical protein IK105_02860 [Thermoguttaceae bacterium]|nr:hypothetical protein [Thermoguttaceae bacterium]